MTEREAEAHAMVAREAAAWNAPDADALVVPFRPDMRWRGLLIARLTTRPPGALLSVATNTTGGELAGYGRPRLARR